MAGADKEETHEMDRLMFEAGAVGKAELSSLAVTVALATFGLLQLLLISHNPLILFVSSTLYFLVLGFGVWLYANHQMYASMWEKYLERMNPNFQEELRQAAMENWLSRIMFSLLWSKTPYRFQKNRVILTLALYVVSTVLIWFVLILHQLGVIP